MRRVDMRTIGNVCLLTVIPWRPVCSRAKPALWRKVNPANNDSIVGDSWGGFITRQIWPHEPEFWSKQCQQALQDELNKLRSKETWDVDSVQEVADVKAGKFGPAAIRRAYAIMGENTARLLT
eukprot:5279493-Amphidinium_carterae.2